MQTTDNVLCNVNPGIKLTSNWHQKRLSNGSVDLVVGWDAGRPPEVPAALPLAVPPEAPPAVVPTLGRLEAAAEATAEAVPDAGPGALLLGVPADATAGSVSPGGDALGRRSTGGVSCGTPELLDVVPSGVGDTLPTVLALLAPCTFSDTLLRFKAARKRGAATAAVTKVAVRKVRPMTHGALERFG
jgi:hypothetical protein